MPVNYNDGRPVEAEFFIKWKMRLDPKFGGWRIVPPSAGCWQGQVENTHEIEVLVFQKQIPALREMVMEIGRELGQSRMYFDAPPPSVELIDPETGLDDPEEQVDENDE